MSKAIFVQLSDGTIILDEFKERLAKLENERALALVEEREKEHKQAYEDALASEQLWNLKQDRKIARRVPLDDAEHQYGAAVRRDFYNRHMTEKELSDKYMLTMKVIRGILEGGR